MINGNNQETDIDANDVETIKESVEFVRPVVSRRKDLAIGPDSCCLEDGKCYRCGQPHVNGCFEPVTVFGNLRVGEKYPEVLYDRKVLKLPLCEECAKVELEPSWGFCIYLQEKAVDWEYGDGPSVQSKRQTWNSRRVNNGEDEWTLALKEQERGRVARCGGTNETPECTRPERRQTNSNSNNKEKKRNSWQTNVLVFFFALGLSLIFTFLTRYWIEDELSYVFKDKVTGRITNVEQKEEVSWSRRRGRARKRHYTKEIEHYSYNVDGQDYRGTSTARWSKYKEGESSRVPIYYDPDRPSESRLFSVWWVFTKVGIGCFLMWVFFWSCIATIRDIILMRAATARRDQSPGWMFLAALVMLFVALLV